MQKKKGEKEMGEFQKEREQREKKEEKMDFRKQKGRRKMNKATDR